MHHWILATPSLLTDMQFWKFKTKHPILFINKRFFFRGTHSWNPAFKDCACCLKLTINCRIRLWCLHLSTIIIAPYVMSIFKRNTNCQLLWSSFWVKQVNPRIIVMKLSTCGLSNTCGGIKCFFSFKFLSSVIFLAG